MLQIFETLQLLQSGKRRLVNITTEQYDHLVCLPQNQALCPVTAIANTVQTPVSDHPKCQAQVVAYWRWSLTGSKYSDLAWKRLVYWETGRCGEVVATTGPTVVLLNKPIKYSK